ncbi:MAG: hypothetical protein IPF52_11110 [Saprospiraceae bacterium]|nr:hypothetical protein [Saprospiraceae bacterium]
MEDSLFMTGLYDHLHLGVMYLEKGDFQKALEQCKLQENKMIWLKTAFMLPSFTGFLVMKTAMPIILIWQNNIM